MEVMNPVNFQQLQQRINGLSKEYFSYSTTVKDRDFSVHKSVDLKRNILQENTAKLSPSSKNQSRALIAWGCGEFGQHGLDQSGDVTYEMAFSEFMSGELMLPDGELPVTTVCGSSHTLVLTGADQVYSWGNGSSGQLGNGTCMAAMKPALVPMTLDGKIQGMSCGARHSFIWTIEGYCYSFGNNFNAQLGYNFSKVDFKENQLKPILVELFPDTRVKEVACGARHSLFLLSTGCVMSVGSNQHGQIGNDTTEDVVIPTMLDDLNSITHVACGNIHSLASHENGFVYAWGYGKAFGNKTRHVATPQKFTPKDIESNVVISLAAGDCHSMILYDDGKLFTWGNNYEGQLGVGKDIKYENEPQAIPCHLLPRPVKQIACGETTSAAVTGKGELFLWGKNAGLIYSDKPSQYFQYIPHHIKMDGLFVLQVSCGAWHVSVIVKHSADNGEMFHEVDSEWYEAEQPTVLSCETASCENGDNIVSQDTTEKQKNENCWVKSMDEGDRSLESSQSEIPQVNSYDNHAQLKTNSMDMCFITKCSSDYEFSTIENECDENEMLAKDKQINKYSLDATVDQHEEDSSQPQPKVPDNLSLFNAGFYDADETAFRANDPRNVIDPSFHYDLNEEYHESCLLSIQDKKEMKKPQEGDSTMEKQDDSSRTTKMSVHSYLDKNPTTTYSQKHPSLSYTSKYGDKPDTNNSLLQKENKTPSCTSVDLCSIEFTNKGNISLDKGENDRLLNASTRNNVVKNNEALRNKNDARNDNECDELDNQSAITNDFVVGNNGGTVEVETNKEERKNHWNEIKSPQAKRKARSITEKNISEVIPLKQNSTKESLVLRRNIKLAVTPSQNRTIKSTLTRNTETKQATTAAHNKTIEQESKLTTPIQNNTIDCYTQVLTRQPTVPVVHLGFGKTISGAEQSRIKPSFTTFRNVWKASNLLREKQRQKMIGTCNRRGSDGMFSLESMLPNRPIRAVKEIEKWSKMNEELKNASICVKNDFLQELRTQSNKAKCCHHKGQVLPPICSCKKNGMVMRKRDALTNIFIDRK